MARMAFYSFHYKPDNWRASQVRNMGLIEGNRPASDNEWESIEAAGDTSIQRWIDGQIYGKSVSIVLIGSGTAGRKWINYEIKKSWDDGKGLIGIYIHNLQDRNGYQSSRGGNPFDGFTVNGKSLATIVRAYDAPYTTSTSVYSYIQNNMTDWIEEAIKIRGNL